MFYLYILCQIVITMQQQTAKYFGLGHKRLADNMLRKKGFSLLSFE